MEPISSILDGIYRTESRRVFATLVRMLGDFDLAEEALHETFAHALEQWPRDGIPENPRAWLVSTGRFRAINVLRRRAKFAGLLGTLAARSQHDAVEKPPEDVDDDRLRLIFTCCHPALAPATQIALTLREVCGLTTEEIAAAFLTEPATIAQRIVRGKAKIRTAKIPYLVPELDELPGRLESVLDVVYLVFNEGYSASSGDSLTRVELSAEAIRLGRLLVELLPDAEAIGLLALMLLHESRRPARASADGELILLEEQDRMLWDRALIAEGRSWTERALAAPTVGTFAIQAAIAAVHANAETPAATDWRRIAAWYDLQLRADPSPVVELNRAVAMALRDGPGVGLALVDAILNRGDLADYHLAHAARADFCRRLGRFDAARVSYEMALERVRQAPERRFLERRLREISE